MVWKIVIPSFCNFKRPKNWDKLSVNIDHVYCARIKTLCTNGMIDIICQQYTIQLLCSSLSLSTFKNQLQKYLSFSTKINYMQYNFLNHIKILFINISRRVCCSQSLQINHFKLIGIILIWILNHDKKITLKIAHN